MRTSLTRESPTPPATERSASFFVPGTPGARGRDASPRPCAGRPRSSRGRPHLLDGGHRLGRDPDRSLLCGTDRGPDPSDGRQLPDRPDASSSRTGCIPRAVIVTRLVTPPAGAGRSFEELLIEAGIPALEGVDTRALTLELRRGAARKAVILPEAEGAGAIEQARQIVGWEAVDHVAAVSTPASYRLEPSGTRRGRATLVDFGVKRSLLRALTERGLEVVVLPHDATAADVGATDPDLVVLSPGPGDPSRMTHQIEAALQLAQRAVAGGPPVLGICLGHQLLALAAGAGTRRLAVGHHGGNHAVLELATERVDIGAHNHEIEVVDGPRLGAAGYRVSHRDLNDGTVEGLLHASGRIASVQFHPEGAPGPIDAQRIFDVAINQATA